MFSGLCSEGCPSTEYPAEVSRHSLEFGFFCFPAGCSVRKAPGAYTEKPANPVKTWLKITAEKAPFFGPLKAESSAEARQEWNICMIHLPWLSASGAGKTASTVK